MPQISLLTPRYTLASAKGGRKGPLPIELPDLALEGGFTKKKAP